MGLVVSRYSRRSGTGREAIPEVRYGSKGPPEGPGVVQIFSQRSERCREALPEVWEVSGGPTRGPGWV